MFRACLHLFDGVGLVHVMSCSPVADLQIQRMMSITAIAIVPQELCNVDRQLRLFTMV